jgi:hypothetical protein
MDGMRASASDDVRSAKAEKQQLLRFDGAAQRRDGRGDDGERASRGEYRLKTT